MMDLKCPFCFLVITGNIFHYVLKTISRVRKILSTAKELISGYSARCCSISSFVAGCLHGVYSACR